MAKKIIELNNGRVKRTGNRIGGDRSSSESVGRRNGNAGYMARLQRFADEQSASDIADALAGGYESAPVPAVALAQSKSGGDAPRFYIGDIVQDADVVDSRGGQVILETEGDYGSRFIHLQVGEGGRLQSAIMS
ncbi:MAG: hypothetical protein IPP57_14210 [Candidatus Obscuribacter sp.]|jgi:hypothetical protein|nr:hypothetical protein [Candidatus Obscuribacter sp.]MBK7839782.1 hypothetical protein [Candidatus Obscuribacter sp.]MBK9621562.1 hypothetical protein [Candidatus Obscuribacter sp.]MBK9771950.1 hypothetical protein [Candidatus Obscuribacter sp.]